MHRYCNKQRVAAVYKTNGWVSVNVNSPVAISLIVQQSYGLGVEAVKLRSILDLDLALWYRLPCGSREKSMTG